MKNRNIGSRLVRIGLLLLLLGSLVLPSVLSAKEDLSEYGNPFTWVTVGKVKIKAEVVKSLEKMLQGLGQHPELPEGRGMLFIMPELGVHYFRMRNMRFPIDIIWLASGRVVGITKNISPQDPEAYPSPEPVDYVLEVPGGFCERSGIKVGDKAAW